MKNQILIFGLACFVVACEPPKVNQDGTEISTDVINVPATASDKPVDVNAGPTMGFNEEEHDFGKIVQGEKVSYSFVFKNTGGSDLVISSASASCGCTVPNYPKTPIKSGETAKIDVQFDSSGKSGLVKKTVTLVTNCNPSTKMLTITATIDVPEEE
jgi:hypothetical protein